VNILLDTQIAVLAVAAPERLTRRETRLIQEQDRTVFVSLASALEIAIKNGLPRQRQAFPFGTARALALFRASGFEILPISESDLVTLETLPLHHADPFDRLLIAQSFTNALSLLTRDAKIALYFDDA
jgi:PIN domain nuclease of toxin-antitoxin system